ncbi:cytochrome P450 [Irpex lacteus]|nr:cytochrome P450 [Irpex lacteus]
MLPYLVLISWMHSFDDESSSPLHGTMEARGANLARCTIQTLQHLNSSARENIELGEDPSCFASELIAAEGGHGIPEKAMSWLSGVMIVGGVDTVAVTLCSCVLAFLHYPDVLQKAHHELDMQVGRGRAPCFEDKDHLPYLRAIISEALRWYPPAPLGMPHASTEDSWYGQYFIPKGTIVLGNICAMNRDPSVYVDPDVFRPERFLDVSGKLKTAWSPETHHMGHTSFGFGKRICPGMHFCRTGIVHFTGNYALDVRHPTAC